MRPKLKPSGTVFSCNTFSLPAVQLISDSMSANCSENCLLDPGFLIDLLEDDKDRGSLGSSFISVMLKISCNGMVSTRVSPRATYKVSFVHTMLFVCHMLVNKNVILIFVSRCRNTCSPVKHQHLQFILCFPKLSIWQPAGRNRVFADLQRRFFVRFCSLQHGGSGSSHLPRMRPNVRCRLVAVMFLFSLTPGANKNGRVRVFTSSVKNLKFE